MGLLSGLVLGAATGRRGFNQGRQERESSEEKQRQLMLKLAMEDAADKRQQARLKATSDAIDADRDRAHTWREQQAKAKADAEANKPKLPLRGTPEYNKMIAGESAARRDAIVSRPMPSRARTPAAPKPAKFGNVTSGASSHSGPGAQPKKQAARGPSVADIDAFLDRAGGDPEKALELYRQQRKE